MEAAGRWTSLANISTAGTSPTTEQPATHRLHRSLEDIRGHPQNTMGDILDHGSPASGGIPDPTLLDVDSDGQTDAQEIGYIGSSSNITDTIRDNENLTVTPMAVDTGSTSDTSDNPLYLQCRTARRTGHNDKLVSITGDSTFGSCVSSQSPHIGNLPDHAGLNETFHGSRVREGSDTVNQSISVSFDPSKLVCVTCKTGHQILGKKPATVFFSDQNFIASMAGSGNTCLNIVRMEDASLSDLYRLSCEILGNTRLPEGSVLMFGSASYLSRVGSGLYAKDWTSLVSSIEKKFPGIRICPLIPLILTDSPGSLAREISEVAAWLATVYENNPLGLLEPWTAVAVAMESLSVGSVTLPNMDTYKVAMPQSLSELSPLCSLTFCAVSSRPVTLRGLPKDTLCELVRTLIQTVNRDFQSCSNPEEFLVREPMAEEPDTKAQKVILLGASNLGRCADHLKNLGISVIDLTSPGWIATPDNVSALLEKLNSITCSNSDRLVLDLYGNLSYRFRQFDGTVSLPYKSDGRYHLAGDVVACPIAVFKKIVESTSPLFTAKKYCSIVVVPPLPRYLYGGCCRLAGHCSNVSKQDHPGKLLGEVTGLRNCLKQHIAGLGLVNCRVLDTCCVASCTPTADLQTRVSALKEVTAKDHIHFTAEGYANLVQQVLSTRNPPQTTPSHRLDAKKYYWRGFRSTVGAISVAGSARSARGYHKAHRTVHHHPYRR
jgi:hypothetical protein